MKRTVLFALLCVAIGAGAPRAYAVHAQCSVPSLTVNETSGSATLTVIRSGDLSQSAMAEFTAEEQVSPPKWETLWRVQIPFAPGADRVTTNMPIVNDSVYIGQRNLRVGCGAFVSNGDGSSSGATNLITVTVVDDEPFPTVHFSEDLRIREGESITALFTVTPPFGRNKALVFNADSATATWRADFNNPTAGTMLAGATTGWVTIPTIEDELAEPDEIFLLRFFGFSTPAHSFVVTILDDDHAPFPISLDHADYAFIEGGPNAVTITRGGDLSQAATATLHIATETPSLWPADLPITFAPGQSSKTISMPFDDHLFSDNRSASLQVIASNGFAAATAIVTMTDDDSMPVLSMTPVEVLEGAAGTMRQAEVVLTLSMALGTDLHLGITTINGTADSSDFTPVEKKIFFAPGSLSQKVLIDIHGDNAVEPDETFKLRITDCCGSLAFLEQHEVTVTIRNDDDASHDDSNVAYRFPQRAVYASESAKWLTATIARSGDTTKASTVQARLTTDLVTRVFAPVDVRFRAGETSKEARFYIDDAFYSGGSRGTLELFVGARRDDSINIGIDDDESKPVLNIADVTVAEGPVERKAAFVMTVTPPSYYPIAGKISLDEYSTSGAKDFLGLRNGQDITIPPMTASVNLEFSVLADNIQESNEAFRVSLIIPSTFAHPALATMKRTGLCTIRDYDTNAAGLTLPDALARGEKATVTLTFVRFAPFDELIPLSTSTPDLVSVPATVKVLAGKNTATFEITALRAGNAMIDVQLPFRLGPNKSLHEPLFIYAVTTPIVPDLVRLKAGETAIMNIALPEPAGEDVRVAVSSQDRTIAAVGPWTLLTADEGTIEIVGASVGRTALTITLPMSLGGTTTVVPVEVFADVPGKTRAARH